MEPYAPLRREGAWVLVLGDDDDSGRPEGRVGVLVGGGLQPSRHLDPSVDSAEISWNSHEFD